MSALNDRTPRKRRRKAAMLTVGVIATSLVSLALAAVGPRDRRLTNTRTGISLEAPPGWTFSQHAGYAETIALLLHPDGSRISVTATATDLRDAAALFQQNRPGLLATGLAPTPMGTGARGSLSVDLIPLKPRNGDEKIRQQYLVREVPGGRQGVILTLASGAKDFPAKIAALDFVASRMVLEEPAAPARSLRPPASDAAAAHASDGGSPR